MIIDRRNAPSAPKKTIWIYPVVASIFLIGVMVYGWSLFGFHDHPSIHKLNSPESVADVLSVSATIEFESGEPVWRVPTGLFIQSFAFITPVDVNLTGYIWQKYPADYPSNFERGIIFPEEVTSVNTVIREAYRTHGTQSGTAYETIGWYFDVTVRQSFDYSDYPLDAITIWLRIWPKDWDNDDAIILVPDFDSYAHPFDRAFGLDTEVVKGEWEVAETYFSYVDIPYDSNFGYDAEVSTNPVYLELFYNIGIRRRFINAFVIHLVPLLVVALLLYAAMLTVSIDATKAARYGFNAFGMFGTVSALFFVVLLAHIHVRERFSSSGLVYIEWFYLTLYAVILFVAANGYLASSDKALIGRIINYRDNLFARMLFWPVIFGVWAMITLVYV